MIKVSASNVKYSPSWVFFCSYHVMYDSSLFRGVWTIGHIVHSLLPLDLSLANQLYDIAEFKSITCCYQMSPIDHYYTGITWKFFSSDHSTQFVFYSRWFFSLILSHETNILLMIKRIYCWNFQLLINDAHKNSINERFYTEKRRRTSLVFLNSWTM